MCVLAVALLAVVGTAGWLVGHHGRPTGTVALDSVDVGFARDMSAHHNQAIEMAGYTRDHTSDRTIKLIAYDIETEQYFQYGELQGWLSSWGLPQNKVNAQQTMAWMGHTLSAGELMPGMATKAQLDKLETLTGKSLDVPFLQLMIHHHQGGLPMARYAAAHATTPYVRNLAGKMAQAQSAEIVQMEQLLRERGGAPLPVPTN